MMEHLQRLCMDNVLIWNTKYAHLSWALLCCNLCHCSAETAKHAVFLNSKNLACLLSSLKYYILIEWLQREHINNTGIDTILFLEHTRSLLAMGHRLTCTNDCQVITLADGISLAQLKWEIIILINIRHSITAYTNIGWFWMINQCLAKLACLAHVAWQVHFHTRECAQHCYIVQTVMCCTQLTISHTTTHAANLNWHL